MITDCLITIILFIYYCHFHNVNNPYYYNNSKVYNRRTIPTQVRTRQSLAYRRSEGIRCRRHNGRQMAAHDDNKKSNLTTQTCCRKTNEKPLKSGFRVKTPMINFVENNIPEGTSSGFCINLNTKLDIKGTKNLFFQFFK